MVFRDAATGLIQYAHTVLRLGVAFVRRFEKITGGVGVIARHATALGGHETEIVLRASVALRSGVAIPLRRVKGVLLRSKASFVQPAQIVLGLGAAVPGERKPYGMRTGIVAGTRRHQTLIQFRLFVAQTYKQQARQQTEPDDTSGFPPFHAAERECNRQRHGTNKSGRLQAM